MDKDYVDRETTVARKWVQDAETAIRQQQEDMRNADKVGSTSKKLAKSFEDILKAMGDRLSVLASSHDEVDGEHKDDDEDSELGKLSKDDEPGWVMGTISRTVQHREESI